MSVEQPGPPSRDRFVISPRPAVRAFAQAALLAVLGVVVVVAGRELGLVVPAAVLAVLLVAAAVVLVVLALRAGRRGRVLVTLDDEGYRVSSHDRPDASGRWAEVSRVTAAPGRITLHTGEDRRTHLVAPPGSDADLDALGAAIGRHLDADRGYRTFTG